MKKYFFLLITLILGTFAFADEYGAVITLNDALTIEEAIQSSSSGNSAVILVEGEVTSVCQAKGCWMGFSSQAGDVRVRFENYGFFVPFSIVGKTVQVEGRLKKVTLSLEESKHMATDGGGDPDSVTEPQVEYQLMATGVKVIPPVAQSAT